MKINEKNMIGYATCTSPVDKEGYLSKKGDVKSYQRRWFVLKGNLLFYFDKKQDKEPSGLIVLESCSVQASASEKNAFEISFDGPGTRTYFLVADNDEEMQSWMRAVSHASYEYLKSIVTELQRQVDDITSRSRSGRDKNGSGSGARASVGSGPLPQSKPSMKIENGIIVDIDQIPPVPPKRKGRKSSSQDEGSSLDSQAPRRVSYSHPHASPVVPLISSVDHRQPLSPAGTLDRTPTLTPIVTSPKSPALIELDATNIDYDTPPPPVPHKSEARRDITEVQPFVDQPMSHSSAVKKQGTASSTDHSKSVYKMHQDFTEAMQGLKNQQPGHPPY